MNIIITGSLGNIGKPLTETLVKAGHNVTVVSNHEDRKPEIESLGAKAAIGSVLDKTFLANVFKDADAVFAMTPPNLGGSQIISNNKKAGEAFAAAFREAKVKRVVMLSSVGADHASGNGPIAGLHAIEHLYNELPDTAVTFLRAGYFYTNYYNDIPLITNLNIIGANYPAETIIPLVHPKDIAAAAAEELQKNTTGKQVRYIVSDVRPMSELATLLGKAAGKPALPWVEFTDEQYLQGLIQAGVPEEIAGLYTEMGSGFRKGAILGDYRKIGEPATGAIKLEGFAEEFAGRF